MKLMITTMTWKVTLTWPTRFMLRRVETILTKTLILVAATSRLRWLESLRLLRSRTPSLSPISAKRNGNSK